MQKQILIAASIGGLLAVVLGAFGAHSLKNFLDVYQLSIWEKGVQYQFYHSLALLGCALYLHQRNSKQVVYAAYCFLAGITCFSGSLYLLATNHINHLPTVILGPVTPIGGLFFIAGWVCLLAEALKLQESKI